MAVQPVLTRQQKGRAAEEAAARFLSQQGYCILQRNYRNSQGEIDMVATVGQVLVFVEVRSRSSPNRGLPEETVGYRKQKQLRRLANYYLWSKNCGDRVCRFDVVGVIIDLYGAIQSIELITDAF